MALHLVIQRVAEAALLAADTLLADWLPDGQRKGEEYWPTNPVRRDRKPGSFSINLTTGVWHDFASGDGGGDLVSLLAYLQGCRQGETILATVKIKEPQHGRRAYGQGCWYQW